MKPLLTFTNGLSETFKGRFFSHVDKEGAGGCWIWTAYRTPTGYGTVGKGGTSGKIMAHRASWIFHFGPVPDGLCVLHHCDNPPCVNPSHLFLGTQKDNVDNMFSKGRQADLTGVNNPACTITVRKVESIRTLYKSGHFTIRKLSVLFHTSWDIVSRVVKRKTWAHIK